VYFNLTVLYQTTKHLIWRFIPIWRCILIWRCFALSRNAAKSPLVVTCQLRGS
jgi:hypothetical protein